jgi:hypothetical protein
MYKAAPIVGAKTKKLAVGIETLTSGNSVWR